jgi:hypothetical protein
MTKFWQHQKKKGRALLIEDNPQPSGRNQQLLVQKAFHPAAKQLQRQGFQVHITVVLARAF